MPEPTIEYQGHSVTAKGRIYEIDLGTIATPAWTIMRGLTKNPRPQTSGNEVDDSDVDTEWDAPVVTTRGWEAGLEGRLYTEPETGEYPDWINFLSEKGERAGEDAEVRIRTCMLGSGPRAYAQQGKAIVMSFNETGEGREDLLRWASTLKGSGPLERVAHPYPATP